MCEVIHTVNQNAVVDLVYPVANMLLINSPLETKPGNECMGMSSLA